MEEWGLIEIREVGDEEAARLLLLRAFFFFLPSLYTKIK